MDQKNDSKQTPILCHDDTCTGCSACANICPVNAIELKPNDEGFYRPNIDASQCIGCLLCEKHCPICNPLLNKTAQKEPRTFAAWHKSPEVRRVSSSGGAFSALAKTILDDDGCVVGAAYDENMQVRHIMIESEHELSRLRLSKYVQSFIGDIFKTLKKQLEQGRKVLFVGTPCQAAGLKSFLNRSYDNLIVCDFICHGVPSAMVFFQWVKWLEKIYSKKIISVNFRDKRKGWYDPIRVLTFSDGHKAVANVKEDSYVVGYYGNCDLQYCCYDCQFLKFPHVSDLTLGDYWGIGKTIHFENKSEIENGISLIIANNDHGLSFVLQCHDIFLVERDVDDALIRNQAGVHSSLKNPQRDSFYQDPKYMTKI